MSRSSPTVQRRWLAKELKRLRQEAGKSQGDLAKVLRSTTSKVSMLEGGQRHVQEEDLKVLLALFELPEAQWDLYIEAALESRKRGWWESHGTHTDDSWALDFIGLEQGAERLRVYQPGAVHGLLQTRDYATALFLQNDRAFSEDKIRHRVEQRLHRQAAIFDDVDPLNIWIVLDEAVLWRSVGDQRVMAAQIAHLINVAESKSSVTLQLVPFSRGGGNQATQGAFTILNFSLPRDTGLVYIERKNGAAFLESLSDIDAYVLLFEHLLRLALSPEESISYLRLKGEEYTK